jgi:D-tyrosyl-tRNA(Tyr) deacylase
MRAVVQRVSQAKVTVEGKITGAIDHGLCVLIAAGRDDDEGDARYLVDKIINLRIFADDSGRMNRTVFDIGGGVLAVSQFTLYGDVRKGRRPAFTAAMEPGRAEELYDFFVEKLRASGLSKVGTGVFRATMAVDISNDGPVTILLDSKKLF